MDDTRDDRTIRVEDLKYSAARTSLLFHFVVIELTKPKNNGFVAPRTTDNNIRLDEYSQK